MGRKSDRQLEDVFVVQDEITQNVVATIEPHLYEEESLRVVNQPPDSVATWGLVVRALTLINKADRTENQKAQALLESRDWQRTFLCPGLCHLRLGKVVGGLQSAGVGQSHASGEAGNWPKTPWPWIRMNPGRS